MALRTLRLAGTALVAAAMLAPVAAGAQYYSGAPAPYHGDRYADAGPDRDGYQRGYDRRGYRDDRGPPQPPHRAYNRDRRADHCNRGGVGTILGAIAGGLIGNAAVGRHGNQAAGTLAGAGAGALVGNAADRDCG